MNRISYIEDFETWKKDFEFSIDTRIRFYELDPMGHANNASIAVYLEDARIQYFKKCGFLGGDQSLSFVVADVQTNFIKEVYFDDILTIYVKANSVGNSSVDFHYLGVKQDGSVCITGRSLAVYFDSVARKSKPFSEEERQRLLLGQAVID